MNYLLIMSADTVRSTGWVLLLFMTNHGIAQVPTNGKLFEIWKSGNSVESKKNNILEFFISDIQIKADVDELKAKIHFFQIYTKKLWTECGRKSAVFEKRHRTWLNRPASYFEAFFSSNTMKSSSGSNRGRPMKPFSECSLLTKKRRVQDLVTQRTPEELQFAARRTLKSEPPPEPQVPLIEVFALYLDMDMTEKKYERLRAFVNRYIKNFLPSLYKVQQYKKKFVPAEVLATDVSAEVDPQVLLNKTAESIIDCSDISGECKLKLTCKWGFDGSAGHSSYKQKFVGVQNANDEFLFVCAMVPILLSDIESGKTVWFNGKASSTLFCRPFKLIVTKENADLVRAEELSMNEHFEKLSVYRSVRGSSSIEVHFEMLFTMIDGSVANVVSGTNAAARCLICNATPKEMNSDNITGKPPNRENFGFGLSTLHMRIRCFELLLHIAYRLPFKQWQIRGDTNKQLFAERKKKIQEDFKIKMGLNVDKPKPGFGSTNDGNTARRFFFNSALSSEITEINKELIEQFSVILRVLASGVRIDSEKFGTLLCSTKQLYLQNYNWYYMPSSVHRLLIHGRDVVDSFDLPIGLLSEEALEANHKIIRSARLHHSRKSSRANTNRDLINYLILNSDPLISSHRQTLKKNHQNRIDDEIINQYLIRDNFIDTPTFHETDTAEPSTSNAMELSCGSALSNDSDDLDSSFSAMHLSGDSLGLESSGSD